MALSTETNYEESEKLWFGWKKNDIYGANATLGEEILRALSRSPEKFVQISDTNGEKLTAAQLLSDSRLLARKLIQLDLRPGDVVGICAMNTTNLTSVIIAALLCGTPWNAVYSGFDKESIKQIYKITKPTVIFCDVENYATVKTAVEEMNLKMKIFTVNGGVENVQSVEDLLKEDPTVVEEESFPCSKLNGDSTAVILCSSGTTGSPKGVLCSHRTLLNNSVFFNASHDSIFFSFNSLYWISGVFTLIPALLNASTRIITDKDFTPEYFQHLVEHYRITHVLLSPNHSTELAHDAKFNTEKRLDSIQTIISSGSKVPKYVAEKLNVILGKKLNGRGFIVGYGLSELGGMLTETTTIEDEKRRYDCEGKLMPNTEARIIDKISGEKLGPNETGLLQIRMPYRWSGYYGNEKATLEAYKDYWLDTGDVAYFDEKGFLNLCAREKDVFKSNSFQIYPIQIEEVILHLPGVAEVCVYGEPNYVATNLTACAVVRTNDDLGENLIPADIIEHVKMHMAETYHIKGGVYFVNELPKNNSGKVLRSKVFEMINSADS